MQLYVPHWTEVSFHKKSGSLERLSNHAIVIARCFGRIDKGKFKYFAIHLHWLINRHFDLGLARRGRGGRRGRRALGILLRRRGLLGGLETFRERVERIRDRFKDGGCTYWRKHLARRLAAVAAFDDQVG